MKLSFFHPDIVASQRHRHRHKKMARKSSKPFIEREFLSSKYLHTTQRKDCKRNHRDIKGVRGLLADFYPILIEFISIRDTNQ